MPKYTVSKFSCVREGKIIRGKKYAQQGSRLPIMILSHGFMSNAKEMKKYAKSFAQEGYACFTFDFCGGSREGKSNGNTTEMTVFTEADDLKAVIKHAKAEDDTDENRVILMGCSQGGFVSGIVAAQMPDEIEKLIMYYPALCIPDDARAGKMLLAEFDPENIPEIIECGSIELGRCYPECVMDQQPEELLCAYKGPVLIIHGAKDDIVKLSYSEKIVEHLNNGSLIVIKKAGHGFEKKKDTFAITCTKLFLKEPIKEIMAVDVCLTGMTTNTNGEEVHISIPFKGKASGKYFNGKIQPGASDEQIHSGESHHMCATYAIKGKDYTGAACTVNVVNSGYGGAVWTPVIRTDSEALSSWNHATMYAVLEDRKKGPIVHIFMKGTE